MSANATNNVKPATGKLGILTPGMGAVATTVYAGVLATRLGNANPVGSLSQLGYIDVDGTDKLIKDVLPLAGLEDIVFGGWDPYKDNAFDSAVNAGVLSAKDLMPLQEELSQIEPMKAVFDLDWVKNLTETNNVKSETNKWDMVQALRADIQNFKKAHDLDRIVMVWCGSTEAARPLAPCHESVKSFEQGLKDNDPLIAPSQMYSYAALCERVPYANGAPNVSTEAGCFHEMAMENRVPVCGKDFKTGQTLMKTIVAPGLKTRMLGMAGWFSTNILGNRDGEVLDDPENFKAKENTKLGVLEQILDGKKFPELYANLYHKVRINYYPPRGDDKEGWDNIDIFGWMGYPMQIKIDFLCKDSILAAPLVLDLALFMDLAGRAEQRGVQDWLGFYFKCPLASETPVDNDIFAQNQTLLNQLRQWVK